MQEQGRAIGADDLRLMPHVEIDVGMIVGRRRAHALEFLDADLDPVDALVVHQMRHERLSHGRSFVSLSPAEIAREHSRALRQSGSARMLSFDSDGVSIAYSDEGEGEPILLIHGFASNVAANWRDPAGSPLSRGRPPRHRVRQSRAWAKREALRSERLWRAVDGGGCAPAARPSRHRPRRRDGLFDGRADRHLSRASPSSSVCAAPSSPASASIWCAAWWAAGRSPRRSRRRASRM